MQSLIRVLLRYRNVVLIVFLAMLGIGAYAGNEEVRNGLRR